MKVFTSLLYFSQGLQQIKYVRNIAEPQNSSSPHLQ